MNRLNKIILASASPRRKKLLEIFNIPFEIRKACIKEVINHQENPVQIAMALAFEKAFAVSKNCDKEDIVIAADTIVVKDQILGKPKNFDDAFQMLQRLQNDVHYVITGIAVVQAHTYNKIVDFQQTKVKIKQLTEDFIKRYIDTEEIWDKAGSYAIQGKGSVIVEWIEGDYFNVVGLPIGKLQDILNKYFNINLL